MKKTSVRAAMIAAVCAAAVAAPALASHAWSTYHWKKTGPQATPPVVTAITDSVWGDYVDMAVVDWNKSDVIESPYNAATNSAVSTNPKTCRAQSGKILVCNAKYGQNGWLGIASIWLSGGHITQGTTKLNDTYFNMARYNTPSWRALVTCQEIGHDYGLGHQDEDFGNADVQDSDGIQSCMDYTDRPAGNEHPNGHDYDELEAIYDHTESNFTAVRPGSTSPSSALSGAVSGDNPADWGRAIGRDAQGRPNLFIRDVGVGAKMITHVLWAIGEGPGGHAHGDDGHAH